MDQRLLRILGGETARYPYALENKYPRVFGKIMSLWDLPEIEDYFMELVVDKRGDRAGFPPDVATEIVQLSLLHASQHQSREVKNVWDVAATSFIEFGSHATTEQSSAWTTLPENICASIENLGISCSSAGFLQAAETGNRAALGLFLSAKANTEVRDERGWTALMLAALNGHVGASEILLKHGANVFATDAGGNTALHWAAFSGQVDTAKLLIENHADVDARSSFGWTALLQATARRHLAVVMLLINHGANLNAVAQDGNSALHKAASTGYAEIIRPLLAHHADTKLKNLEGETAVKLAIKNNHELAIKLLLSAQQTA